MKAVHRDDIPLVYAFLLLTGYEGTVKYIVADRPCGNTQSFRRNIGVHPSGTSLDTSLVLPLAHADMVAASSWGCEADSGASRSLVRVEGCGKILSEFQESPMGGRRNAAENTTTRHMGSEP